MKKYFLIVLLLIVANYTVSGQYDTAITVLQPSLMAVHNGLGNASNSYWFQDSSGYVQDSVTFPVTRNYRFDFTGRASGAYTSGLWPDITISINGVVKATININRNTDSIWSTVFSVGVGRHAVRIGYTDQSSNGSNKMIMGLLYVFSSTQTTPVKYPAIARRGLPVYGSGFITTDDFTSGHLRGMTSGIINKPSRTIINSDWDDLQSFGMNIFRVWVTLTKSGNTYTIVPGQLDTLDVYLKRARARGIYLLVVVTNNSGNGSGGDYWGSTVAQASYRDRFIDVARRYKDSTEIAGFALINEPDGDLGELCEFEQGIALGMRRVDTNHVIVVPAPVGLTADDIYTISEPLPTNKTIYEVHFYQPFQITHQGINANDSERTEYPNSSASAYWNPGFFGVYNKTNMQAELKLIKSKAFSNRYNIPIFVGEFGCVDYAPNYSSARYVSDAIDIFEANKWAWSVNQFRAYEPWDFEIPSGQWYGFTYVNAFPQVSNLFSLHPFRTDTTLTAKKLKQWFTLNSSTITVGFSSSTYTAFESIQRVKITVTLSDISPIDVSINVTTSDGTAIADSDYTPIINKKVVLKAGILTRTFCVPIIQDAIVEPSQSFTIALSSPTNASIGTGVATVTITD